MKDGIAHLPSESADLFTKAFARFLRIEALSGAVLLLCTIIALVLSNTAWSPQFMGFWELRAGFSIGEFEFDRSLKHWVNDGLMTLFFFVVALELKRELVLGELRHPRMAAFPLAAAFGGMITPAGLFMLLVGSNPGASGWGTVMSTDTAFVIGCLAVLGSRLPHSLRLFLLSLAIFDDVGAILVVAVAYGDAVNWVALGSGAFGIVAVAAIAHVGNRPAMEPADGGQPLDGHWLHHGAFHRRTGVRCVDARFRQGGHPRSIGCVRGGRLPCSGVADQSSKALRTFCNVAGLDRRRSFTPPEPSR